MRTRLEEATLNEMERATRKLGTRRNQSLGLRHRSSRRGRQQHEEGCPCLDISENDALEVATGDAHEVEKHVVAVVGQILEDGQRPRRVGPTIAEEDGLLDASHVWSGPRARPDQTGTIP